MKIATISLLIFAIHSTNVLAAFYDDPENANNKECVGYINKAADAMKMQQILKESVMGVNAKPTPAILQTYYEIYDDISKNTKGVLNSCKLNKKETRKFMGVGIEAEQMKGTIKFLLSK